jgi:glycosyltransferase involved in cell wall biosynthesis
VLADTGSVETAERATEATAPNRDVAAEIELRPPSSMAIGRGNAVLIGGYCYHRRERTRSLAVQVNGSRQPVEHFGLPRGDVHDGLAPDDPARPRAYRSGFVTVVDLHPIDDARRLEIELVLTLADGSETWVMAGGIDALPQPETPGDAASPAFPEQTGARVAICMATYEPPPELLRIQLDSIRDQGHGNWICLISDDCSSEEGFSALTSLTEHDPRFVISRSRERLGFYRNFERALSMAPTEADFVTLCDQDDRWHPDKLERLLGTIGDAQLAYSDARIVSPAGELVRPSYWTERRNNYTNFASLLLANSVTGAASLFRRDLLDDALPLPPRIARGFHDHWLAIVAMARGEIAYLDDPLWDYVQHEAAVIGHLQANKRPKSVRRHLIERLRNPTGGARAVYYYDWQQQLLFGRALRLRCGARMTPAKRRTLDRLLSADDTLAGLAWMLGRRARRLWGHDETLDRELFYGHALARHRAVSAWTAGRRRPGRLLPRDAAIPPNPYGN